MLKIIVHAYIDNAEKAIVEGVFASSDKSRISEKMAELTSEYPDDYLAIYDLLLQLVKKSLMQCV